MRPEPSSETSSNVVPLRWRGSDEALCQRVRHDVDGGAVLLCDRFGDEINRLVWSLLGPDADHDDVVQDIYVNILAGVRRVREPDKLASWVRSVTIKTVRWELRKRSLRRKRYFPKPEMDGYAMVSTDVEGRQQLRYLFGIVERLSVDQRLAFSLRFIHRQSLPEVARMCGCSLTTIKRRLGRAEKRIAKLAARDEGLRERLERGSWKKNQ